MILGNKHSIMPTQEEIYAAFKAYDANSDGRITAKEVADYLTKELLEMKENFATQLLDIANKIEPGVTKIRGQILLELQIAQVLKWCI